jgi:acetyl-CoA synthase
MGVFHMGQRSLTWVRISKDAFKAGLRLKHFGELLRAEYLQRFPALVIRCRSPSSLRKRR